MFTFIERLKQRKESKLRALACHFCERIWNHYPLDWADQIFAKDSSSPGGYVSSSDWENPMPREAVRIAKAYCAGLATREELEQAHQDVRDFAQRMYDDWQFANHKLGDSASGAEYEVGAVTFHSATAAAAASAEPVDLAKCRRNAALAIGFRWDASEEAASVKKEERRQRRIHPNRLPEFHQPAAKSAPQTRGPLISDIPEVLQTPVASSATAPKGPAILINTPPSSWENQSLGVLVDLLLYLVKESTGTTVVMGMYHAYTPESLSLLFKLRNAFPHCFLRNAETYSIQDLRRCSQVKDFVHKEMYENDPKGEQEVTVSLSGIRQLAIDELNRRGLPDRNSVPE
jgi:hypothetical protein